MGRLRYMTSRRKLHAKWRTILRDSDEHNKHRNFARRAERRQTQG